MSALQEVVDREESRAAAVVAARARVDLAVTRYAGARRTLARLETRGANEPSLQVARDDVYAARVELSASRRALIGSMQ